MQTLSALFSDFMHQLTTLMDDLADWVIFVFDPNSGPWPKIIVGAIFFLIVMFVVTKASKTK